MVYDPAANGLFAEKYPQLKVSYYSNAEDVCHDADIVVILTAWSEFKAVFVENTKSASNFNITNGFTQ